MRIPRPPVPRWELPGASVPRAIRVFAADYPSAIRIRARTRGSGPPGRWRRGGGAPVVLIPGVFDSWRTLALVADRLNHDGHPVLALPELRRNRLRLPDAAEAVRRALEERDLRDVVLVTHSKGGVVGKLLLAAEARAPHPRIARLVAVAAPFHGSTMASFMPSRPLRDFRVTDAVIRSLAEEREVDARITSIYPVFDPHIPEGSHLAGARNVRLRMAGHFAPLLRPAGIDAIAREVGRGS